MDGYAAIANAQYFLGLEQAYFWQRGPGMSFILIPAEWIAESLNFHPLDVRAHHTTMILLHLGLLWFSWKELVKLYGPRPSVFLGFVAAVPCYLFFSYSPFVSHDLFPGIIVLWMLRLQMTYIDSPSAKVWFMLVLLGCMAALIKQTYALFWPITLVATWLSSLNRKPEKAPMNRAIIALVCGATLSGIFTFVIYSLVLADSFPGVTFWMRPWAQAVATSSYVSQGGETGAGFDQWIYIRNLSASGVLAMALILPGIGMAFLSGKPMVRATAVAWTLFFVFLQLIPFKEVRYVAFLAPLTAVLIVPVIAGLYKMRPAYGLLLITVWMMDLWAVISEASRLQHPYYRSVVAEFLKPLPLVADLNSRIIVASPLSFVSPDNFALRRDRYHRISSLIGDQIQILYKYPAGVVRTLSSGEEWDEAEARVDSILLIANDMATRRPPFRADNQPWLRDGFSQLLAVAETVNLELTPLGYRLKETRSQPVMIFAASGIDAQPLTSVDLFDVASVQRLRGLTAPPAHMSLLGFRIKTYCDEKGCRTL